MANVDVVAVLRMTASALGCESYSEELDAMLDVAIDAVAELIAAVESERAAFQRMKDAERDWKHHGLPESTYRAVVDTHHRKRAETAAALAACKPATGAGAEK